MSKTEPKVGNQQPIGVLGWLGIVFVSFLAGCLGGFGAYLGTIAFLQTFLSDIGQAGIFFLPVLLCTPILGFLALGGITGSLLRLLLIRLRLVRIW